MNNASTRLAAALLALAAAGCGSRAAAPVSDHFDGNRFFNPGHVKQSSVAGYLQLRLTHSQPPWPERVATLPATVPATVDGAEVRVTMIGHATLLIQTRGLNLLTDPMFSERASPLPFAGPQRVSAPAIALAALPRIDVVLISHDHYDHLDLPSLTALDASHRPRVVVPLGNRARVAAAMPASTVTQHDWGERVDLAAGVRVHVEPMLHASGRTPFDQQATLWAAFLIDNGAARVYFVGDSSYGDGRVFRAARAKFGDIDLALLPIGAYEPQWFMADSHMRPADAVRAMLDSGARAAAAHHFDTFQLGFEAFGAAERELAQARQAAGLADERFVALRPGQSLTVGAAAAGTAAAAACVGAAPASR